MKLRQARKIAKACATHYTNWHFRLFNSLYYLAADQRIVAAYLRCYRGGRRNDLTLCNRLDGEFSNIAEWLNEERNNSQTFDERSIFF